MAIGAWDVNGHGLLERERELAIIAAARETPEGRGSLVLIEGSAGEGKSALLEVVGADTNASGLRIVDDAQGLDGPAVAELVRASRDGAHVIAALAPEEPGTNDAALAQLRAAAGVIRLCLTPLTATAIATLITRRLDTEPDGLVVHVLALTAGNPLMVKELLAGDPWQTSLLVVGDRMAHRARKLSPEAPGLLLTMAVLGDGRRLNTAADAAGLGLEECQRLAHRLRRMGILASEDPFNFAQPIGRLSIIDAVPDAERHRARERAAAALVRAGRPAHEVAAQLEDLPPRGATELSAAFLAAAEAATEPAAAVRWLRRALAEAAPEPARVELLERLGRAELLIRDAAAIEHLRSALDLTRDPARRARLGIELAEILAYAGQWEAAMGVVNLVEPDLNDETEDAAAAFLAVLAITSAYDSRRVGAFAELRPRLEHLARGPSWSAHAIDVLLGAVDLQRGEPAPEALARIHRALGDGVLLAGAGAGGWATPQVLHSLVSADELSWALKVCDAVDAAARAEGSDMGRFVAAIYRGFSRLRGGELAVAERELRQGLNAAPGLDLAMVETTFLYVYAEALVERPGLADLVARVGALALEPEFAAALGGAQLLWPRALTRLHGPQHADGIQDLRAAGAVADRLGFGPTWAPWRSVLALALGQEGREEARTLVDEELQRARSAGLGRPTAIALRAAGALAQGEEGVALLKESLAVLDSVPSPLERARSLIELGAVLRRARRSVEAREPLGSGLALAEAAGAVRLAARARAELAAAAGRPARRDGDGGALTSSELRVARLAARGATNREIADELFLSVKTVETHLSRVYAKFALGGRGARAGLGSALGAYETPSR